MAGAAMAAQYGGALIGTGFNLAGGFMGASAASKRKDEFERLANTPGLDFGSVLGESFGNLEQFAPRYGALATEASKYGAGAARAGLETMLPGYGRNMEQSQEAYEAMARGELPEEELGALAQRGAERGVGYGMPGSEFTGRLGLRDLGISGLQWREAGLQGLGNLRREAASVTPQAPSFSQTFQGAMPGDTISMRATERANRIQMLLQAAGMPTGQDVWAQTMTNIGSQWASAGGGGGGGGVGGGGGGGGGSGKGMTIGAWQSGAGGPNFG
jgi:hypothetical protein